MILIKVFDEKKWARHFLLSGEMRFSKPSFFHDYEDNYSRRDEKDGLEGMIVPVPAKKIPKGETVKIFEFQIGENKYEWKAKADNEGLELLDSNVEVSRPSNVYIYSMFMVELDKSMLHKTIEEMKLDGKGKYCVIVHNPLEFSNRMKKRMRRINKEVKVNKVKYVDFSKGNKEPIKLNYYTKDIKYEGQNEVRFVMNACGKENENISKNYHCGNISDIAILTKVEHILDYIVSFAKNWGYIAFTFPKEKEYKFIKVIDNK